MMIVLAGPAANMLVAIGLYACILAGRGETTRLPIATTIAAGSPAAQAGFEPGDQIVTAGDKTIATFTDLAAWLHARPGQIVDLQVERKDQTLHLRPRLADRSQGGRPGGYLGIEAHSLGHRPLRLTQVLLLAPARAWNIVEQTVSGIVTAVTTGQEPISSQGCSASLISRAKRPPRDRLNCWH